ncbi:13743_t:CDS:10 [Cetraspora pellucida]|uniref:13743_t:CDS:1 n=1 Tax=Cetraspora pellucida TaxID=1433469 RepID=A0A9N9FAT1_9GLOM|nr:13743_t:CDS:10 [Cetraspora pellucida]
MSKTLLGDFWKNKSLAKGLSLKQPESTGNWKDIDIYKPSKTTLSVEEYDKLFKRIRNGFVLQQLQEYVKNHDGTVVEQHVKGTKNVLIKHIINNIWKISTFLNEKGESLKWLETQANVKIDIDLNTFSYKISGLEKDVHKAKDIIAKLTSYTSTTADLPPNIKDEGKSLQEMMPYVQDICRSSGSFIELGQKNQIVIYGQTLQNIRKAQRLLNIAWKKPDENENHLVLCSNKQEINEYSFLPVHDVVTLPVYHRNMHWHRLDPVSTMGIRPNIQDQLHIFSKDSFHPKATVTDFNNLGDFVKKYLSTTRASNPQIELHSLFGHIIFHDKIKSNQNLFTSPIPGTCTRKMFEEWSKLTNPTRLFLPSYPSPILLGTLKPLSDFRKIVQLEYLPSNATDLSINRLSVQFDVINNELKLKEFIISRRRLLIDMIMMDCPKDIRLLSITKESLLENKNIEGLIDQCKFQGDVKCPKEYTLKIHNDESVSIPYSLDSVKLYTCGYYEYNGFTLIVKKVLEQETNIIRPEVKLLYVPVNNIPNDLNEAQNYLDFDHWDKFIFSTLEFANLLDSSFCKTDEINLGLFNRAK